VSPRTPSLLAFALACGGFAGLAAPAAFAEGSSVRILIDAPKPGEKVVNDGMPRLVAGAKVEVRTPGPEGGRAGEVPHPAPAAR